MKKTLITIVLMLAINTSFATTKSTINNIVTKPNHGSVVLTFDDGPNPKFTPQILAILKKENVHAVFFVMGMYAKRYPDLIKKIIADGNLVENHTMTHPKLTKLPKNKWEKEIADLNPIIKKISGTTPLCVRPPFGLSNSAIRAFIHQNGMQVIMWDVNSFDYNRPGVKKLIHYVVSKIKGGDNVLMHDGPFYRQQTVDALPAIIEGIRKKGLGFALICYHDH